MDNKEFKFPVVFLLDLFTGSEKWTAPLQLKDMFENPKQLGEYVVDFKYLLLDATFPSTMLLYLRYSLASQYYSSFSGPFSNIFSKILTFHHFCSFSHYFYYHFVIDQSVIAWLKKFYNWFSTTLSLCFLAYSQTLSLKK